MIICDLAAWFFRQVFPEQKDEVTWHEEFPVTVQSRQEAAAQRPTLIVVDVQDGYMRDIPLTSWERLLRTVADEILLAMENDMAIVFVEYPRFGKTVKSLTDLVEEAGYENWSVAHKAQQDGSQDAILSCEQRGFNKSQFRVVGIFTSDCIYHTVQGLLAWERDTTVDLAGDACYPASARAFSWYTLFVRWYRGLRLVRVSY